MAVGGPKGRKGRIVTFLTICKFVNLHKKINFQPILLPGEEDRGLPLLRESPLSLDPTSPPRWMSFFTYSACLLFQDTQRHEFGSNCSSPSEVVQHLQLMLVIHWQWQVHISLWLISCFENIVKLFLLFLIFHFADIPGEDGHTRNSSTTSQTGSAGYSSSQSSHGTTAQVSWNSLHLSKTSHLKNPPSEDGCFWPSHKSTFSPAAWAPIKAQQWWFEYTTKVLREGTQAQFHWIIYILCFSQLACVEV